MTNDETLELAHRKAWRYKKSSDPHHSDTYTFNQSTLLEFARNLVEAEREACAERCEQLSHIGSENQLWMRDRCAAAIRARSNAELTGASGMAAKRPR